MATPRQLVETVAESLGASVGTVIIHDRNLSTAPVPLRTVAGRGKAAAVVTFIDATNLLIAAAASEAAKDSVETVHAYRDLRNHVVHHSGVPLFDDLPANHTFGQALEAFLIAAATEAITSGKFSLRLRFFGPRPMAEIGSGVDGHLSWSRYDCKPKRPARNQVRPRGDLERMITITEKSIFKVGKTLGESL